MYCKLNHEVQYHPNSLRVPNLVYYDANNKYTSSVLKDSQNKNAMTEGEVQCAKYKSKTIDFCSVIHWDMYTSAAHMKYYSLFLVADNLLSRHLIGK